MKLDPLNDGVDHINVYSKGKTALGRFLTNFAYSPIITEDGPFQSIEGYWYWLGCKDDDLRMVHGWEAKQLGRALGASDWQDTGTFKTKIMKAIEAKLDANPARLAELRASKLPSDTITFTAPRSLNPKTVSGFCTTWQRIKANKFRPNV